MILNGRMNYQNDQVVCFWEKSGYQFDIKSGLLIK
jgi:hypothetical protein